MRVNLSSFLPGKKTRLGMAAGFLATVASIPILSKSDNSLSAAPTNEKTSSSLIREEDYDFIQALRKKDETQNMQVQETKWAEKTYPTIRKRLISLYEAEAIDNKLLKEGKICEEERKVKICYTDFVGPEENSFDAGSPLNLHVVKYYDEKQNDGSYLRTYVNEHWPINESTNSILLPEAIRVRVQVFKGKRNGLESLKLAGAEYLFLTDSLQIIWGINSDGSKGNAYTYPLIYRQHLYGDFDKDKGKKKNSVNQTLVALSSPTSCMSCHHTTATMTEAVFDVERTNFGAVTPDEEFEKPYEKQRGYKIYMDYLRELVKKGKCTEKILNAVAKDLLDSTNMQNPYMAEALKENNSLPWAGADYEYGRFDFKARSYTYKTKENKVVDGVQKEIETRWKKAGFDLYLDQLLGVGEWWDRDNLQVIPRYSSLK